MIIRGKTYHSRSLKRAGVAIICAIAAMVFWVPIVGVFLLLIGYAMVVDDIFDDANK